MPRAKKVIVKDAAPVEVVVHTDVGAWEHADAIANRADKASSAFAAPYGKGLVEEYAADFYTLATIAATQLTVTPHDSNDIIDLRIDRALFIAGKLLAKAKELQ